MMNNVNNKNSILCVSDGHQRLAKTQKMLDAFADSVDKIIFLGDYFDCYKVGGDYSSFEDTCKWVIDTYEKLGDKAIWLVGNHEISLLEEASSHKNYAHKPNSEKNYWCSGYSRSKGQVAKKHFGPNKHPFLRNLKLLYADDYFLYSHAGFLRKHFIDSFTVQENFKFFEECYDTFKENINNQWLKDNKFIWSDDGPLWVRWHEGFEPIEGINQIVGHTPYNSVRQNSGNYCIDTFSNHAVLVSGGLIEVVAVDTL
jgi:hypothetical protein